MSYDQDLADRRRLAEFQTTLHQKEHEHQRHQQADAEGKYGKRGLLPETPGKTYDEIVRDAEKESD